MNFTEISFEKGEQYKKSCKLLIVVATDIEQKEVLNSMTPLNGHDNVLRVYKRKYTYFLGTYGVFGAILVRSGMGSGSAGGAILTTKSAIDTWKPKAIIMIGIAFGVNRKKQNIGDVLVSQQVIPYDVKRIGKSFSIFRSEHPAASLLLRNRFSNVINWDFKLPNGQSSKKSICPILSGEALIDNKLFRDALMEAFPKAKGGDMEATGIYVAADDAKIDWIVVKGICDFADGNKSKNKEENQKIAIRAAISLTKKVFSSEHSFKDLGLVVSKFLVQKKQPPRKTFTVEKEKQPNKKTSTIKETSLSKLKELIGKSEFDKVFDLFNTLLKEPQYSSFLDELIIIQNTYSATKKKERTGTISTSKTNEFYNQIAFSLLELIGYVRKNTRVLRGGDKPVDLKKRILCKNKLNLIGYKDEKGNIVIPCIYLDGKDFSEGVANVRMGLNKEDRLLFIEKEIDKGTLMDDIKEQISKMGKWKYIDGNGKNMNNVIYERAFSFEKGRAKVMLNGEWFYINKKGQKIEK